MVSLSTFLYSFIVIGILILIVGIVFSGCSVVVTDISPVNYKKGMVYYYLPESLIKITSTAKVAVYYNESNKIKDKKVIEQKFVVTTKNIADTFQLLSLKYKSNALMYDHLKFDVNNNGLLKSLSVTTEDKTAAIIDELSSAPQSILVGDEPSAKGGEKLVLKIKEYTSEFYAKPSDILNKPGTITWNILIVNEQGSVEFKNIDASFNVKISHKDTSKFDFNTITTVKNGCIDGILTRPLINTDLTISTDKINGEDKIFNLPVTIIDQSKLLNIPIKRTAFVKRENTIIIEDGLVTSNEITNPSSVKGFVSIPIDIAKAIVSIPGQLVTFRYDNTARLKALEEQKNLLETQILENEKFQLKRKNEINKVIDELKIDELTRANDINKLTIELKTQPIKADKELIDVLKELEIVKKELKKLKESK